jgi:hypothetical protein
MILGRHTLCDSRHTVHWLRAGITLEACENRDTNSVSGRGDSFTRMYKGNRLMVDHFISRETA